MKKLRIVLLFTALSLLPFCVHVTQTGYRVIKNVGYRTFPLYDNTTKAGRLPAGALAARTADLPHPSLAMDIYLPEPFDPEKQYAGALFLYGCGWQKHAFLISRKNWRSHAIALAKRGYISFAIDYRLSPEFFYPAPNDDAQYALDLITGRIHPEFISQYCRPLRDVAIVGFSSGGTMAALMGTGRAGSNREHVRCIAVYAGLMDLRKSADLPQRTRTAVDMRYLAGKSERVYDEASPLLGVDKAFCPFLLQAGKNDVWYNPVQIELMTKALHKRGIPVETYLYEKGQHGFQFLDIGNGPTARQRTIDFITRYLPQPHEYNAAGNAFSGRADNH